MNEIIQNKKGKYYVVFRMDDTILGYIEDEVHDEFIPAENAKNERVRLTGIDGENNGYYEVLFYEGDINSKISKKQNNLHIYTKFL